MRSLSVWVCAVCGLLFAACFLEEYETLINPSGLGIVRRPNPYDFGRGAPAVLPAYDPTSSNSFQIDLRSSDLSKLDLHGRGNDLLHSVFDSKTRWPADLPADFSPSDILEMGKNPGLGIRSLHHRGITGKGIGIAIIDQSLLVDHAEYKDQLKSYEEIHWPVNSSASMHGPAVASIAVGKTVGVAPDADLYFIAEQHGTYSGSTFHWNFRWVADAIDRVLEIDTLLPRDRRIRVISISVGWGPDKDGYAEVTAAVERAKQAGIFVISSSLRQTYGYRFHGLGRAPMADPDQPESYEPAEWWAEKFYADPDSFMDVLLAPMDSMTFASFTGNNDYCWGRNGGWSWTIPYLAGVYALACQVKPDVTPEVFWNAALQTGATITVAHSGTEYQFGKILDSKKLIDELSK